MSDVVGSLRQLRPLIEEHAAADPQGERLAEPVVDAVIRDGALLRMWLPQSLGGEESPPTSMLDAVEEVASADGATGWVAMAAVFATACAAAYCGEEAALELWGDGRLAVMQGAGMPGTAEVVDGGYVLRGKWSYGSGIKHATHVYSCGMVREGGEPRLGPDGEPEARMLIVPVEEVELGGNWDVLGLRRTGSVDYMIDGVFVPEEYTHSGTAAASERGGSLYTLGMTGLGSVLHTAWAIGNGRRALDELAAFAAKRAGRAGGEHFQIRSAQVHAQFEAACALVRRVWEDIETTLEREEALSTRQQTMYRVALNHVSFVSADVTEFVFRSAGGTGLRAGTIQRCFRDANASTQHAILSDRILTTCGRELLGLAPGQSWIGEDELGVLPTSEPVDETLASPAR